MPRFLIIRFSSIGDIVLTTPVVRTLAAHYPDSEIHFLTKPTFRSLVETNPHIHKVWLWEEQASDLLRQLKAEKFDFIIDLHHNLRSQRVKLALGGKSGSFNKLNVEKYLYVNFRMKRLPNVHIVDRYMETVQSLGVMNDGKGLDFFIRPDEQVELSRLPEMHRKGFVAVVTGALKGTKRMPIEELTELCRIIDLPLVLLGGKAEMPDGEAIASAIGDRAYNLCGELNIGQSASLVQQSNVVLTHDTGLMHIAAAFHKPIVSIWGNTVPEFGMYPYLPGATDVQYIAQVSGLKCRPCSKIGYDTCPKKHFRCMRDQDLDAIAFEVRKMFKLQ